MGVDRGQGDLETTCVVSRRSADWGEIIDRYLDDPGVVLWKVVSLISALRSERGTQPKIPMILVVLPGVRE